MSKIELNAWIFSIGTVVAFWFCAWLIFKIKKKRNVNIKEETNPVDEYDELHRKLPRGYKIFPIISDRYFMHHNFDSIEFYSGGWFVKSIYLHGKYDIDLELTTKNHVVLKPITMDEFWEKLKKLQDKGISHKAPKD